MSRTQSIRESLIRGGALFLGGMFLWSWPLYFAGPMRYDATIWWVDLRFLPGPISVVCSLAFGVALLHRAVWPEASERIVRWRRIVLGVLVAMLLLNALSAWRVSRGGAMLGVPIPLSAVIAAGVWCMGRRVAWPDAGSSPIARMRRGCGVACVACCFALLAALSQMVWFGESDYRRPADAILVYGCKAHANGKPSQALADRVHTAAQLYHQGLAPHLIMSGGPVRDSDIHETQVMANYAVSLGVPREAIRFDAAGLNTQATADNLPSVIADLPGSDQNNTPCILAVSHDYHLPRVKLTLERQGLRAYTVPAEVRYSLPAKPYYMARETAAWWVYFFKPIVAQR